MQTFDITVKDLSGAYVTQTVRGHRASSTCSAEEAAKVLGGKLFGEHFIRAELLRSEGHGTSQWRLSASTEGADHEH